MVKKSVGVKIAEGVSEYNNINDTVWIDACCTLADEIDIKLEDAKREGAINELKLLLNDMIELSKRTNQEYSQNFWEGKIRQKITILQSGETK